MYVLKLLEQLNRCNYKAYLVGGCVRDSLLGKAPQDFDITTNARPMEIKKVFWQYKTVDVGEKFGTVVVALPEGNVEITTFRQDGDYINGRKPENINFSNSLIDDLKRRDFTINAMAYSPEDGIIDCFNGKKDLEGKVIRAVGRAELRISEDYLRVLRAIRFSGQLNFEIEESLQSAIRENAYKVQFLSAERIAQEFFKILLLDKPSKTLRLMQELGVLEYVVKELSETVGYDQKTPYHVKTLFDHLLCVVDNVALDLELRLAALFHDIAKPRTLSIDKEGKGHFYGHEILGSIEAANILKRLKTSNRIIENVQILIENHMKAHEIMSDKALRRQINNLNKQRILKLYDLMIADRYCTLEDRDIGFLVERKERIIELIHSEGVIEKKILSINGRDLIELGFQEGKIIGKILDDLLEMILEDPKLNEKSTLLKIVAERYNID